jgi:hypothetical protein
VRIGGRACLAIGLIQSFALAGSVFYEIPFFIVCCVGCIGVPCVVAINSIGRVTVAKTGRVDARVATA